MIFLMSTQQIGKPKHIWVEGKNFTGMKNLLEILI